MTRGITAMYVSKHRGRTKRMSRSLTEYVQQFAATNTDEMDRLKRNLIRAMNEEVSKRQRTMLVMYYVDGMKIREIAKKLNVSPSTVSRTIKRGEENLRRCLRFGAGTYLMGQPEE